MQCITPSASTSGYIISSRGSRLLLLLLLLATNATPTLSSSPPLPSSQSHQRRTITPLKDSSVIETTTTTTDVLGLTCDATSASWGLPCSGDNRLSATKTAGHMNLSKILRPSLYSLLPLSSSLPYMKRLRTKRLSSWNGVINSFRGGGTDDEEEYGDEDETDCDSEEVSDDDEISDDDEDTTDGEDSEDGDTDDDEEGGDECGEQSSEGEHESEYDEYDEDEESEYDKDEESEYDEDEGDDAGAMTSSVTKLPKSGTKQEYDEPLALSPMHDMGVTLGVMVLCNKLDLTNTRIIRYARFTFIAYIILAQVFLIYARHQAHKINDRTPITISNPLSNMLQSQLGNKGDIVKNVANSILSSKSTIMEYDLSQAKNMNNGLLLPMVMLFFLHFKMGQVQPLFFQTASGIKSLVTSPLFQVYVLGRNLERPFQNPQMDKMKENQAEQAAEASEQVDDNGTELDQSEEDSDVEDTEESDDSDSDSDDFDSDEDSEYDDE